jgi:chorismate mutase
MEDTITFHLIERVQFPLNKTVYVPGALNIGDSKLSLLDWMLREQERLQSLVRRYQSPDEYPFFPEVLQEPILQPLNYPKILHTNDVVVNDKLKNCYINHILPDLRRPHSASFVATHTLWQVCCRVQVPERARALRCTDQGRG